MLPKDIEWFSCSKALEQNATCGAILNLCRHFEIETQNIFLEKAHF